MADNYMVVRLLMLSSTGVWTYYPDCIQSDTECGSYARVVDSLFVPLTAAPFLRSVSPSFPPLSLHACLFIVASYVNYAYGSNAFRITMTVEEDTIRPRQRVARACSIRRRVRKQYVVPM